MTARPTINEQRENRAGALRDRAEGAESRAKAFHGLVELIRANPAPVQRWQEHWDKIANDLEKLSDQYLGVSKSCLEHIDVLTESIEAHSRWIPQRPKADD